MTSQQLMLDGLGLMLLGVGTVFLFLALLILCIRLMSAVLGHITAPEPTPVAASVVKGQTACSQIDTDTLNAIQIAIELHRSR